MIITIDTKKDHPEEIEHAIRMLSALLNKKYKPKFNFERRNNYENYESSYNNYDSNYESKQKDAFSSDSPTIGGGFASMFGDDSSSSSNSDYSNDYSNETENISSYEDSEFKIKPY